MIDAGGCKAIEAGRLVLQPETLQGCAAHRFDKLLHARHGGQSIHYCKGALVPISFTLRQLEYLTAVGDCGSISLAAGRLNISAPSVSTAIAQLEAEFGVAIFIRKHSHGMSLTPAGRELVQEAARVLQAAGRLGTLADVLSQTVRGPLNLGCLLSFAQIIVPRLRRAFVDAFPQVDFQQHELHQAALIEGLRDATLDVALTYDLALPRDLQFCALAELPPFVMLPGAHPLAHRASLSPQDLAAFPMVLLDLPLSAGYFLSFFEKTGINPVIAQRSRDMAVVRSLVANNFGYSIANIKPMSNRAPDGKALHFVPLTGPVPPMRMGLIYANSRHISPTIQAFIKLCEEQLPPWVAKDLTVPAA